MDAPGLPNVRLTPEEKRVYDHLFRQVDELNAGVVTADVAVKFFEKTRLDQRILYEVRYKRPPPSRFGAASQGAYRMTETYRSGPSPTTRTAAS